MRQCEVLILFSFHSVLKLVIIWLTKLKYNKEKGNKRQQKMHAACVVVYSKGSSLEYSGQKHASNKAMP